MNPRSRSLRTRTTNSLVNLKETYGTLVGVEKGFCTWVEGDETGATQCSAARRAVAVPRRRSLNCRRWNWCRSWRWDTNRALRSWESSPVEIPAAASIPTTRRGCGVSFGCPHVSSALPASRPTFRAAPTMGHPAARVHMNSPSRPTLETQIVAGSRQPYPCEHHVECPTAKIGPASANSSRRPRASADSSPTQRFLREGTRGVRNKFAIFAFVQA